MTHLDYKFSSILRTADKTVVNGYICVGKYRKGDKNKGEDETKDYYESISRLKNFVLELPANVTDEQIKKEASRLCSNELKKDEHKTKKIIVECINV